MRAPLRVLDLFSGFGGFSVGLEAAGMRTTAFCEVSATCRHLLSAHWPEVPQYDDVQTLTGTQLAADGVGVDVMCGGFPCQDISVANTKAKGIDGARSGLWREYDRLIGEVRPRVVIVENSTMLLGRGLGRVLGDLASRGYDAVWDRFRGFEFGSPIHRDRLYILAFSMCEGWERRQHYLGALSRARKTLAQRRDDFAPTRLALVGDYAGLRDDHGFPLTVERARIHGLGNAVCPPIPEAIGREVVAAFGLPSTASAIEAAA